MDVEGLSRVGSAYVSAGLKKKKDSEESEKLKSGKTSFVKEIKKASEEQLPPGIKNIESMLPSLDGSETLEELVDNLHVTGEALKKDPVLGPLKEYKNAVRLFLRYILDNGLEIEEVSGIRNPRNMKQKKYVLISVVDEKLEKLAVHVLQGQADQLEILRRIDEINGLLINITG